MWVCTLLGKAVGFDDEVLKLSRARAESCCLMLSRYGFKLGVLFRNRSLIQAKQVKSIRLVVRYF